MQATVRTLLDIVGQPHTIYETPIFQRKYSWTERQCEDLFNDILAAGKAQSEHFMGLVLYGLDREKPQDFGAEEVYDLIDGQQRAETMTLLLAALRDTLKDVDPKRGAALADAGFPLETMDATYLLAADGQPKLRISNADEPTLTLLATQGLAALAEAEAAFVKGSDDSDVLSELIVGNVRYFAQRIADLGPAELATLGAGLHQLIVVAAELEEGDQPQLVFETLNSRGMPLSTTDLIRNLLLSRYDYEEQALLFERYWQPVQELFFDDGERLYEDAAVYSWLKEQEPDLVIGARSELYQTFKAYVLAHEPIDIAATLQELSEYCLKFMESLDTPQAKAALDWARGRLQGLVSERHLFGD